ncbi:ATP-grasp domain-containing protein [Methylocystis sp. MJC1]|jgi:3-methylcrotonyl-CoA carboxylase alpha subunit|uniref:acetyl/propionyl/methylcrotonyl-CoA carboxylase subunit alpha n=1 Tax=Methylocystis sp. MJC1 TaxID=2654282 RepID=UPI0013EBDCA0|nr:biotin carboxylase N-terminal domain-containing protein [Methylocystis sp. MJC1]KAF2989842.1 Acetyl-/propionyl-coenzyme A carboxylase alpha chain [Methylocystis sp. MJC1]MBU6528391.1 ATP-grasp domain-containing protein [Methylocystis sp. MJC1]UZX11293.1 ATP-grasp domain-containing protein [Methylocystis sp. MJC1]
MFRKALIANRGEIACRIMRTARAMGVATVAVYSDADANSLHVAMADEAFRIGPSPAQESYLSIDRILEAAHRSGAGAIHPGYGFLSENADFAERCEKAGIAFIGPPAGAMRLMGSKAQAKELMARSGVPILPGYHGEAQEATLLAEAAAALGFPVLVKASAGGGGRGMRVVSTPGELDHALESARREAIAAFGDGRLMVEKYLSHPRHVEVQLFADSHGRIVTFPERDCSLQRRRQKVVEETPADLPTELSHSMRAAAMKAARDSGYLGAGTVEFLVQDGAYYFLEMNARLQVEHPVTEMISGLDLVEWQLRIAAGEPLPLVQDDIETRGCAIEVRICAENPAEGFIPATGVISHLRFPEQNAHVRVDSGVREGDTISSYYDSLLAKLVAWGEDRAGAVAGLQNALDRCELVGVSTNLDFLRALVRAPQFALGDYDTSFIAAFQNATPAAEPEDEKFLFSAAAAAWFDDVTKSVTRDAGASGDPWSPWSQADAWRLNDQASHPIEFLGAGKLFAGRLRPLGTSAFLLEASPETLHVQTSRNGDRWTLFVNGMKRDATIVPEGKRYVVILAGRNYSFERLDLFTPGTPDQAREETLLAPLPARVTRILVKAGDRVSKGEQLLMLEAMKMEITVTAPRHGEVEDIFCKEGETVREGADLVRLAEAS